MLKIILCSDDFGLGPAIDAGILSLVRQNRLNAVSCMVVGETFQSNAPALLQATQEAEIPVEIGLHLTFTEYTPVGDMPSLAPDGTLPGIGALIKTAHLRRLDPEEITEQIARQVDQFYQTFNRAPDFIDGHQHAHILPTIRDALIPIAQRILAKDGWVRSCDLPAIEILKLRHARKRAIVISTLAQRLKSQLRRHQIPTNDVFFGVNDFDRSTAFAPQMQNWLSASARMGKPSLIMCHPGTPVKPGAMIAHDPIADRRQDELNYLASDAFLQDLSTHALSLS